jgi:SAM-dependent methyltransferase
MRDDDAAGFAAALHGRPRVLEVGCGRGELARRLAGLGFAVTAIDVALPPTEPVPGVERREVDFLAFDSDPFDAIVFDSALHQIAPLETAVARAASLLVPGGRLIIEDFDVDAPDEPTLRWFYETRALLAAAGVFPSEPPDSLPATAPALDDLHARWRASHPAPLHTGAEMRLAISARFVIRELRLVEYLHRLFAPGLPADHHGAAIALQLRETERAHVARGTCVPVGLRIVAELAGS